MVSMVPLHEFAFFINLYDQAQTYVGNKYLFSLFILLSFFVLSELFVLLTEKIILRITAKTRTTLDDQLVRAGRRPVSIILLMAGIKIALLPLDLHSRAADLFSRLTTTGIIIFITVIIIRTLIIFVDRWGHAVAKKTHSTVDDAILPLFRKIIRIILWIFSALFILSYWGFDIRGLLAGVGIAGIAIGFAVKDSLANIFGGVSLILDKAIKVGDIIKLDSGEEGTVIDVGLRSTQIRTFDNEVIIIPNGVLANSKVHNYKLPDLSARVVIPFGVAYGTDPDSVKKVIATALKGIKGPMKEPEPTVRFSAMADFSLNFKAVFWVSDVIDRYRYKEEATTLIYKTLNRHKIEIPFLTRVAYLKKK